MIKTNAITLSQASKVYVITKTTLHDHVHNKYQNHSVGVKPVLAQEEEERVARWAVHMSNDYLQCSNCHRRFHLACASDQIDDRMDEVLPFECKYC